MRTWPLRRALTSAPAWQLPRVMSRCERCIACADPRMSSILATCGMHFQQQQTGITLKQRKWAHEQHARSD